MINHIVMMTMKPEAEGAPGERNMIKLKAMLEALPAKIDLIKFYEVGLNFSKSPAAMDIALVSHFESAETLDAYRSHPAHVEVLEFIKKTVAQTAVVDYEF
ncbi:MAG: Dabb family protein [Candidatus Kapaibacterium sp.]